MSASTWHKKTISICVVDQGRNVLNHKRLYCCQELSGSFFEELQPFRAVSEATASYQWLFKLIEPLADRVVLAHPKKLRIVAESDWVARNAVNYLLLVEAFVQ